jgi:hypothetical protein
MKTKAINLFVAIIAFVIATPCVLHAQNEFATARVLKFESAVHCHADKAQKRLREFPDPQAFLTVLAKSAVPARDAAVKKRFSEQLQVEVTVDGVARIFVLPLPIPDGSGPYAFFVHPGTKGGIPQLVLGADDARQLGLMLQAFR